MKTENQVREEVARVEHNIDNTRASIEATENQIQALLKLNERRRYYLRELGQARSELLTYELNLE
jgi:hypothetical protein